MTDRRHFQRCLNASQQSIHLYSAYQRCTMPLWIYLFLKQSHAGVIQLKGLREYECNQIWQNKQKTKCTGEGPHRWRYLRLLDLWKDFPAPCILIFLQKKHHTTHILVNASFPLRLDVPKLEPHGGKVTGQSTTPFAWPKQHALAKCCWVCALKHMCTSARHTVSTEVAA